MTETRKLRTIIFADIVGYTAMMQQDEPRSLRVLNQFKEQVETQVPQHHGDIIQYFGDACLLSFESTTHAVACSLQLQTFFIQEDVPVRIGMHLGEVVFKNNNAFGDGVNIASRIESMGIPGAILLSKAIRDQIKNKPEYPLTLLGSYHFKNVEAAMDLYALSSEGLVVPRKGEMKGKLAPTAPKKGAIPRLLEKRIAKQIGIPLMILSLSIMGYFMVRSVEANAMTTTITFVNADGIEETREIVKKEFRKEFAIFPFEPLDEQDSANAWIGLGMPDRLGDALDQDKYLHTLGYLLPYKRATELAFFSQVEKLEKAKDHREDFYVDGQYQVAEGQYILLPAIRDKHTGTVLEEKRIVGEDLFQVLDSCVAFIRQATGLNATQLRETPILGFREMYTDNLEALKVYSNGLRFYAQLEKAAELDSTFAYPSLRYAQTYYYYAQGESGSKDAIDRAMRHRRRLPYIIQIEVMAHKHMIYQEWEKAEKLVQIQLEIDPGSEFYHYLLSQIYWKTKQIDKLVVHEKAFYNTHPSVSAGLNAIKATLMAGDPLEAVQIAEELLAQNPRHTQILASLAECHIHLGDYQQARETYEKIILIKPETELNLARSLEALTYMENHELSPDNWTRFEGAYRSDWSEMVIEFTLIQGHLHNKANFQSGIFLYPSEDNAFSFGGTGKGFKNIYLSNENGKIYGSRYIENNGKSEGTIIFWKQDSLIWRAEDLLKKRDYPNARIAYEAALARYPEHYYLKLALQHLDYLDSTPEAELQANYQRLVGTYKSRLPSKVGNDRRIWVENGLLYHKNPGNPPRLLRPISDSRFIILPRYRIVTEFLGNGGQATGLQLLFYDYDRNSWDTDDGEGVNERLE